MINAKTIPFFLLIIILISFSGCKSSSIINPDVKNKATIKKESNDIFPSDLFSYKTKGGHSLNTTNKVEENHASSTVNKVEENHASNTVNKVKENHASNTTYKVKENHALSTISNYEESNSPVNDFEFIFNKVSLSLDYVKEDMDFNKIFGEYVYYEERVYGHKNVENIIKGAHFITIQYPDTKLLLRSSDGKLKYLMGITTKDKAIHTARGLRVGDSLKRLLELYPKVIRISDNEFSLQESLQKLKFCIENDIVIEIELLEEIP